MDFFRTHQVIDVTATGQNIHRMRKMRGMTVRDVQDFMGFASPQAVYRWETGINLPSVDNLYMLAGLFHVKIDDILIPKFSGGPDSFPAGSGRCEFRICTSDLTWNMAA